MPTSDVLEKTVPNIGRVEWIGTASEKRGAMVVRDSVTVSVDDGLTARVIEPGTLCVGDAVRVVPQD